MSSQRKRTRITPNKNAASDITVRLLNRKKNDVTWKTWLVQGWKENGRWMRKQFKNEHEARDFAALKRINHLNQNCKQRTIITTLTNEQEREAVMAFEALGSTYSLRQAVEFFLQNHRAPDYTIPFKDACCAYLKHCEQVAVRPRTIQQYENVLKQLQSYLNVEKLIHEVTEQDVLAYLKTLNAKDGIHKAKHKTWNNYRNDISRFFSWSMEKDHAMSRPWLFHNPVSNIIKFTAKQIAEQRPEIITSTPETAQSFFTHLMNFQGGVLVKYYALAYFSGIRPDGELKALAPREHELINLKTKIISIPASVAKTKEARKITIMPNLLEWLLAYKHMPIIPINFERFNKSLRKEFSLSHDEARHSFISYHVAVNRSLGDVALQAGNSESIVKKHYLNLHLKEEGEYFFSLIPDLKQLACIRMEKKSFPFYESSRAI